MMHICLPADLQRSMLHPPFCSRALDYAGLRQAQDNRRLCLRLCSSKTRMIRFPSPGWHRPLIEAQTHKLCSSTSLFFRFSSWTSDFRKKALQLLRHVASCSQKKSSKSNAEAAMPQPPPDHHQQPEKQPLHDSQQPQKTHHNRHNITKRRKQGRSPIRRRGTFVDLFKKVVSVFWQQGDLGKACVFVTLFFAVFFHFSWPQCFTQELLEASHV